MPVKLGGTTYNLQPDTGSSDLVSLAFLSLGVEHLKAAGVCSCIAFT